RTRKLSEYDCQKRPSRGTGTTPGWAARGGRWRDFACQAGAFRRGFLLSGNSRKKRRPRPFSSFELVHNPSPAEALMSPRTWVRLVALLGVVTLTGLGRF